MANPENVKYLTAHDKQGRTYRVKVSNQTTSGDYVPSEWNSSTGKLPYYDNNGNRIGFIQHSESNPLMFYDESSQQSQNTTRQSQSTAQTQSTSQPQTANRQTSSNQSTTAQNTTQAVGPTFNKTNSPVTYSMSDLEGNLIIPTQDRLRMDRVSNATDQDYPQIPYRGVFTNTQITNPEFNKLSEQVTDTFARTANSGNNWVPQCLATVANWDVDHIKPYLGNYTAFRDTYSQVPRDQFDIDHDGALSAWEVPYAQEAQGEGKLIYFNDGETVDINKFPIGTIFYNGHRGKGENKYISGNPQEVDSRGHERPSHAYMLSGFSMDQDDNMTPFLVDYGVASSDVNSRLYGKTPIYAFVRNGTEDLTQEKLRPKYIQYKNGLQAASLLDAYLQGDDRVNEALDEVDPKLIYRISDKYGVPMQEAFQRLMAIGQQETDLGNSAWYHAKNVAGTLGVGAAKAVQTGSNFVKHMVTDYDTMPAWKHEVIIYNRLKDAGLLEGLNDDQIRSLVASEFNREKSESDVDYGKQKPSLNMTQSKGWFQLKPDEYTDGIYDRLRGEGDEDQFSRAYHRFAYLYSNLHKKYPQLSQEQLLNAATVAWNAPSKVQDQEFIDNYITGNILKDDYLSKVQGKQHSLYFKSGGGIHINPKNKGKFTETMKRTGKSVEELTHSKNKLTKKRAIFAQNAKKWHHAKQGAKLFLGNKFQGLATDNGLMVSNDKEVSKSKPKVKLIKKQK